MMESFHVLVFFHSLDMLLSLMEDLGSDVVVELEVKRGLGLR